MKQFVVLLALLVLAVACYQPQTQVPVQVSIQPTQSAPAQEATSSAAQPAETTIAIKGFAFIPATVTVKAGTKVTWTNEDGAAHTVESSDGTLRSDDLAKGDSYSAVLDKPGTYSYICGIHPSMKGNITVE